MADRLRVTELDFDTIKTNLKAFLKQQPEFTDYDFDGAGLSVLIDLLAYNTHYNAYYLNMVANESFLDTALLRSSVVSHAKSLGYTPHSVRAPVAYINFTANTNSTTSGTLTIPKGFSFLSNQIDGKSYNFVVLDEISVTKSNTNYIFENLDIYEGQIVTYSFTQDNSSNPKQIFTLPDTNIDTSTLEVIVAPSSTNTAITTYNLVTDILDVDANTNVFFLQEERDGNYQIYFGNDVVGKSVPDGSIVSVTYLVTNGTAAIKANNFIATSTLTDSIGNSLTNFIIDPVTAASGGSEKETVDDIKFSTTSLFSAQNRLVTFKDYESYILNKYADINSISVWGGEDNPPVFGKVFISLNPKENYFISETEKQRIIDDIITPKSMIVVKAEIIDPEYLYILLDTKVEYDSTKTTLTTEALTSAIRSSIINYKNTNLNKFGAKLVISRLQDAIDSTDLNSIIGCKTTVRLQKRLEPVLNKSFSYTINFNAPLFRGTSTNRLTSSEFDVRDRFGTRRTVILEEIPESSSGISSISVINPGFGYTSSPTVTITGDGFGATAVATVLNGQIQSIEITNRGINYTKATATISGGGGQSAAASVSIDSKIGTLRTIYYDSNAERQTVDSDVGQINYETGKVTLTDLNILSVSSTDGLLRLSVQSDESIIKSVRNTIITIDETDTISIVTELTKV